MLITNTAANRWKVKAPTQIDYDIVETSSIFSPENELLLTSNGRSNRRFVIIDKRLYHNYAKDIKNYFEINNVSCRILSIAASEKNKKISTFIKICKEFDRFGLKRRSEPVIIIGGGVVLDVGSFAANCYRRGVPYIRVPTTLMGYIDGAIGVKTGVNFNKNKNRLGSFSNPLVCILDRSFFRTLPKRHILNGVAEIIKLAIIKDRQLFNLVEAEIDGCIKDQFLSLGQNILNKSIHGMLEELAPNLHEDDLERVVDFGHTFSIVLEMLHVRNLLHGEAVAMDICLSCALSRVKRLLSEAELHRIIKLISELMLPIYTRKITPELMWESLSDRVLHRDGLQRVPLPIKIGKAKFVNNITFDELREAIILLKRLSEEYGNEFKGSRIF
jgi:3-dehydroquinate synthetase